MPRQKDLKRLVRARMKKTGEAYTAARAQIVRREKGERAVTPPRTAATSPPPAQTRDPSPAQYTELAGMGDDKVEAKTGRRWEEWVRVLDGHDAVRMKHGEVAALLHREYGVPDWWSQMVTVGYERIKGLRARGQRLDGKYEASKSRTFSVPVATLFDAWANDKVRRRWLAEDGVKLRKANAPKGVRLGWPDGTIVAVWFEAKGSSKSVVAIAHSKLTTREAAERLKRYWSVRLDALAEVLDKR